ncbi:unnamed protein product [Cylindrotheca closterium]|uniref:SET domain-containing protein n=1 Tax=Cylindrotheca closterium TaxID=2856 RepID=A0AAD2G097_9STRA|nr:unnamed protein product [Cylindrotheca closterium]
MSDPFDVFGSDSDSEDENNQGRNTESVEVASSLINEANGLVQQQPITSENTLRASPVESSLPSIQRDLVDISNLEAVNFPWPNPLFVDDSAVAVYIIPKFGGGRAFCARKKLDPGTTVLVEEPVMEWHQDQVGRKLDLSTVRFLLENDKALNLVHWLESFHPLKSVIDQGPNEENSSDEQLWPMMEETKNECEELEVSELAKLAENRKIVCRDNSAVSEADVLRMLLCIRYNGLESGVYLYAAMLNHSCFPNCAKLRPEGDQTFSEVVTTREVQPGEILTINYCPNIMSHASRRHHLYNQHRFDISADVEEPFRAMELVNDELPPSAVDRVDDDSPTLRVEKSLDEFEAMLPELVGLASVDQSRKEVLKALELSIQELCKQSEEHLSSNHLLLVRGLILHLDVCDAIRRTNELPKNALVLILCRQVQSAYQLIDLQSQLYGPDHFDLARSHEDMYVSISELLSRSPSHLYGLGFPGLGSFSQWSQKERESRNEHHRIKALYAKKTR